MKYDSEKNRRRSIRLEGYDYTQSGGYYVTIVTKNSECLFGDISDGVMDLNEAGNMVEKWYFELASKFPDIQCDEYYGWSNSF